MSDLETNLSPILFFFLKIICLEYFRSFAFPCKCLPKKLAINVLIGIAINVQIGFGETEIIKTLIFPINKQSLSLHLLQSLISISTFCSF